MSKDLLIIFVKAPRPGSVKTRLAQTVGVEAACRIFAHLVERLLANLQDLDAVQLRFTPDDAEAEIQSWAKKSWRREPQLEGDLGQRLQNAFEQAFRGGYEKVAIIGSDCPDVSSNDIRAAWTALEKFDVVLGPAKDGGYWLVALKAERPLLFKQMAWSTAGVFPETMERAKAAGLKVTLLRELSDVDTQSDWESFQKNNQRVIPRWSTF